MLEETLYIVAAFLFSVVCGFIFIPLILNFCKEKRLYDIPNSRKVHKKAIPRLGGVSFLPSMSIAFLGTLFFYNKTFEENQLTVSLWSAYFFVSLLLIYGVGLIDDLIGLGARSKFVVQIIAASLLPAAGLYINNLYGFLGFYEIPYMVGAPLTVFIIVFVNNAINLIDGIDGLSACISLIALTGFLICFLMEDLWFYGILIVGLMGILVPFLYFNLLGSPEKNRKIFMGDSGSLTLGFILGFLSVKYSMVNPSVMESNPYSIIVSLSLLLVPVFDVVRISLMRIIHHRPIFDADKNHIHHKLMRAGLNQHQTLACILLLDLFFITFNLVLCPVLSITWIVVIDIVLWCLFHFAVNTAIRRAGHPVFQIEKHDE